MDYTEYLKAKKLGDKEYKSAVAQGKYPYLPAIDEILGDQSVLSQISIGIAEIPLSMVVGTKTVGRQNSFASNYMPIMNEGTEFSMKWQRLFDAQMDEGIHDAIKAYEYMKKFYVQEGNKRVSVMKYLDMPSVASEVIRIMPERSDDPSIQVYYEFVDFYKVCPIYEITFSHYGDYHRFAKLLNKPFDEKWSSEDVHMIEAAYYRFLTVFESHSGSLLNMTAGDALLVYLSVYSISSLLDQPRRVIESRFEKLRDEMLLVARGGITSFVENPEYIKPKTGGFMSWFKSAPVYNETNPLHAVFIYDGNIDNSGLVNDQEIGRIQVENVHDGILKTSSYFDIDTEEKLKKAIDEAASRHAEVIFTNSPAHMAETLRGAIHYPNIRFLNHSSNLNQQAVRTYDARMFEAKFLMGAIGATMCDNHRIGYLATEPIYGELSAINAFAIGAAMVDPQAKIYLQWTGTKDSEFKAYYASHDVHIISGLDIALPEEDTTEYGLYQVENGQVINLAAPVYNWGKYYDLIIKTVLDHTYDNDPNMLSHKAVNYWYGMSSGVVDVVLSNRIPYATRKLVEMLKEALTKNTVSPFMGELHSQSSKIQNAGTPKLSNEKIIEMDWLNDNIIGHIPTVDELDERAKQIVEVSGVFHQEKAV